MIYLDNASTTKIRKEVLDEMMPYLTDVYGNPSAKYYEQAIIAKDAIDLARNRVASLLNCRDDEVIFTSGATEGNNMVIKGVADYYAHKGKHIITTSIEHASIIETCKYLDTKGFEITYLKVDEKGLIDINELRDSIRKDTILVSVMWVNNEIGSINDIKKIAQLCAMNNVMFHTDATQAVGKIDINLSIFEKINFLTFSAHKIHGPKGIGATIVRKDKLGINIKLTPLIHGGDQESGYRSGTLPIHDIVGLGKACQITKKEYKNQRETLHATHEIMEKLIKKYFGDKVIIINDFPSKVDGIISIRLPGINNQLFLKSISKLFAASTGSTCSINKPSHVLKEIGLKNDEIRETIRISFSYTLDVDHFKNILEKMYSN
jgi:cysteine desulfurase